VLYRKMLPRPLLDCLQENFSFCLVLGGSRRLEGFVVWAVAKCDTGFSSTIASTIPRFVGSYSVLREIDLQLHGPEIELLRFVFFPKLWVR